MERGRGGEVAARSARSKGKGRSQKEQPAFGLTSPIDGFGAGGCFPAEPLSSYPLKNFYHAGKIPHLKIFPAKVKIGVTAPLTRSKTLDFIVSNAK